MEHLAKKPDGVNKVLLIEDDEQLQKLYRMAIEKQGYTVTTRDSHEDVDADIQSGTRTLADYDLIVSDNTTIGDMSGVQFAEKYGSDIPILMCTSERSAIEKTKDHTLGGILKPVKMPQLGQRVNEAANQIVNPTNARELV